MEFVTVNNSLNPAEAQLVRARLEAAGIDATILHENASMMTEGYALATGGVRVQVPSSQEKEAKEILAS